MDSSRKASLHGRKYPRSNRKVPFPAPSRPSLMLPSGPGGQSDKRAEVLKPITQKAVMSLVLADLPPVSFLFFRNGRVLQSEASPDLQHPGHLGDHFCEAG
jgi:hypothetical protein